jgi:hypothetical protein
LIDINSVIPKNRQRSNIVAEFGGRVMAGVTLSPEQIRIAPPEVRISLATVEKA